MTGGAAQLVADLYFVRDHPGMREYGQYCPVALGSEVLADRWTPLILREMVIGSTRFNDIERGLPGISRTLLSQRLRHLERKGVVETTPAPGGRGREYHLTPAGSDLGSVLIALGEWSVRWLFTEPEPEDVDPIALTWWMRRRVDVDRLPDRRVVIEFRYGGRPKTTLWIVLEPREQSVCMKHPGFDSDVVVTTDPVSLMRVFSGITSLRDAVADGSVALDGPPSLTRAFNSWFLWSPFAPAVRERVAAASA
jgi:DNA-binding HxlR family transcriptional regulator